MEALDSQRRYQGVLSRLRKRSGLATTSIGDAYAEIFFLAGKSTGFFIFAATLLKPNVAVCGLIAVFIAFAFAVFIGFKDSFFTSGYFVYNSLLVGFSIGYLYDLSVFVVFILAVSAVLTFLLAMMASRVFYLYLGLPILSIPFTIVSSLIYLASSKFPNLYVTSLVNSPASDAWSFFQPLEHYLIALGSIVFMPNWLSGLLISLVILYRSRIIFFLSISGYFLGVYITSLLIGSWQLALLQSGHFNFILIAVSLGSIFTIVSFKSIFLASIGVALSTLIMGAANAFWSQYSIPIFTLPFIMVTLSVVYVLRMSGNRWTPVVQKSTPEETLEHHTVSSMRCADSPPIGLPFEGKWCVWQGFDGQWTHTGIWKYAYDFVIKDGSGKTHQSTGSTVDQYYCYKKPVYAPVRGKVIAVINSLPDNPIGVIDPVNNWGNFIILWDERGIYIEISHFSPGSIAVYEGQWIGLGDYLGLCGNSGYSPEPHIHIQVQTSPWMGAHTIPFCFQHFQKEQLYQAFGLPQEGEIVERQFPKPALALQTSFLLGETLKFRIYEQDTLIESIEIKVCLEVDGTFYFSRGTSKLYFFKDENQFRCLHMVGGDAYLKVIYMAACHIPFSVSQNSHWTDLLQGASLLSAVSYSYMIANYFIRQKSLGITIEYRLESGNRVRGEVQEPRAMRGVVTELILDSLFKFKRISVDGLRLERFE